MTDVVERRLIICMLFAIIIHLYGADWRGIAVILMQVLFAIVWTLGDWKMQSFRSRRGG